MHDKQFENLFISTFSFYSNNESGWESVFKNACGEKLIYWKDIGCRYTLELPLWGNFNVYLQHMLLKIKKTIWKFTLIKYHVHCLCIFYTSQTANFISIKLPVTLGKLFILVWQLYLLIWVHELPFCYPASCLVVYFGLDMIKPVFSDLQTTKVQTSLWICAVDQHLCYSLFEKSTSASFINRDY